MNMRRLLVVALVVLTAPFVGAQSFGLMENQVTVEIDPRIPQPEQPIAITVESFNTDLDRARISLYVDGILVSQELGKKEYVVDVPAVGQNRKVEFVIETLNKGIVRKELNLRPGLVDLQFEALSSYVPPFYEGKALNAHESGIRVVALPYFVDAQGRKLDPKTLIYSWMLGDKPQPNQSGYGKNFFLFPGSPLYRTKSVTVEVENVDGSIAASRVIDLPAFDPVIRFYPVNPLWGTDLSRAIIADRLWQVSVPEVTVAAAPFYISNSDEPASTIYNWRVNSKQANPNADRKLITLSAPASGGTAQARVSLEVTSRDKILQIAESIFSILFNTAPSSSGQTGGSDSETPFGTSN